MYHKSSAYAVRPICEEEKKPKEGFLALTSAPARRALEGARITTLTKLSGWTERELLELHGMGPGTLPVLRKASKSAKLSLSEKSNLD